jgi:hypothetical protein
MAGESNNRCPVHHGAVRKEYGFGPERSASVIVFRGCRCAISLRRDDAASIQLHDTYDEAAARARQLAAAASKNVPLDAWRERAESVLVMPSGKSMKIGPWEV